MTTKPWVLIIMGSDSDAEVMSQAAAALDEVGVPYEFTVASAHRSPERALFLDDAASNVAAAEKLGIQSVLVRADLRDALAALDALLEVPR